MESAVGSDFARYLIVNDVLDVSAPMTGSPLMCRLQPLSDATTIVDEVYHARSLRQRDDGVRPEGEIAQSCLLILREQSIGHVEDLLHDGVLTNFVVGLELPVSIRVIRMFQRWRTIWKY